VPVAGPGELLVQTLCASVCGSDLHNVYAGLEPLTYPCPHGYPGHEGVGRVLESRDGRFGEGDVVLLAPLPGVSTCFADFQVVPASQAVVLEPDATPGDFVLAQQLGTVIWAMKRFWPGGEPPATATVVGAGSAGIMFTNLLAGMGVREIVVTDLSPERLAMAARHGATRTAAAGTDAAAIATLEATGGVGADLVVEASGHDEGRSDALGAVREDGIVGLFGLPERRGPAPFAIDRVFARLPRIVATRSAQLEPELASFREAVVRIADGRFPTEGMVTHHFGIEDVGRALQVAHEREGGAVKVSLDF
jgi:threonine dehydrogenase-like Zn-dependent dehydrogenase